MSRVLWVSILLFVLSMKVHAQVGGCDKCLEGLMKAAKKSIEASLNTQEKSLEGVVNSSQTFADTIKQNGETLSTQMDVNTELLSNTIAASGMAMELSNNATAKAVTNTLDHLNSVIHGTLTTMHKLEDGKENAEQFLAHAQTLTGTVYLKRANALANGMKNMATLNQEDATKFNEWLFLDENEPIGEQFADAMTSAKVRELLPVLNALPKNVLEAEEVEQLLTLLKYSVQSTPIDFNTNDPKQLVNQFNNARLKTMAYKVMRENVLDKAPLIESKSWDDKYVNITTDSDGKTSFNEFIASETERKLLSPVWLDDIATRNEAGLKRELVYQGDMTNYLLSQLLDAEKNTLQLISLMGDK